MLNRVCCIIDVDGFDVRKYDEYGQYITEFLVRELGYIRVHPTIEYMPKSYRFDLRRKVNPSLCPPDVQQTLNYQSKNVLGLPVLPGPHEHDTEEYEKFKNILQKVYELYRRPNANVVAYKGGNKEKNLLRSMNIPCVDLQGFGCGTYNHLVKTGKVYSVLQDCGHHTEFRGRDLVHCPKAEVTVYRDWYMKNYRRFSTPD